MQIDERRNVETHVTSLTSDASRRCLNSPPVKSGCADVLQDRATQRANVPLNTGPSSGSRVTPIISTIDSRGIRSIERVGEMRWMNAKTNRKWRNKEYSLTFFLRALRRARRSVALEGKKSDAQFHHQAWTRKFTGTGPCFRNTSHNLFPRENGTIFSNFFNDL